MPRRTLAIFFAQGSPGFVFAQALWTTLIGVATKLAAKLRLGGAYATRTLIEALAAGGAEAKRAFDAMMTIKKSTSPSLTKRDGVRGEL